MPQHKNFKKACVEAYGSAGQKARKIALAGKLKELGIDPNQIQVARGNKASRDFPPHVYLAVNTEGTNYRRLRIAENLQILEDQTLVSGERASTEERRMQFTDDPRTLDFYDANGSRRTEDKLVRHAFRYRGPLK